MVTEGEPSVTELDRERPLRVALSNDYEIALLGLARMLARHPRQVQVVDVTTSPEVSHDPDLILYDTFGRVPDQDPKLRRIVHANPQARVVVYSWEEYPEEQARRAGAAAYLHKGLSGRDLVARLIEIAGRDLPAPGADDAASEHTWPGQDLGLSRRESEMLTFITRGLSNEEIARRSFLSINTVKTYVRTAYRRIGVSSRAQAVAWGFQHGFASTDDTGL